MHVRNRILKIAASAAVLFTAAPASASSDPRGVWIDHTGRGAVEIVDCEGALCGRVVWLKDNNNAEACGVQILGNVKPAGTGVWDKGWIYDPEQDAKFSVELKPIGAEKLRVLGYLGTKLFSETMVWQRAPADLQRCTTGTTAALAPEKDGTSEPPAVSEKPKPPIDKPATNEPPSAEKQAAAPPPGPAGPDASAEAKSDPSKEPPAENKAKPKQCKFETPWVSLSFPCPD